MIIKTSTFFWARLLLLLLLVLFYPFMNFTTANIGISKDKPIEKPIEPTLGTTNPSGSGKSLSYREWADIYLYKEHSPDIDGDGTVDFQDLLYLLSHWGRCSGECLADINGDGIVNELDRDLLLDAWGDVPPPKPPKELNYKVTKRVPTPSGDCLTKVRPDGWKYDLANKNKVILGSKCSVFNPMTKRFVKWEAPTTQPNQSYNPLPFDWWKKELKEGFYGR